jgi:multiple sugar transport system ATP-binding protein
MAQVRVENVCKLFGTVEALNEISCLFEDGQLTVLVGPSGCGKTTLLRSVAGLQEISSGSIFIGDEDVAGYPPWERNIAMVFQSYALYPHMTVFKNIAFPLEATRTPKSQIRERVHEAARILQIEGLLDRKPRELSGGQMQRVALGRAIVRQPDVFLMDEPLSNLDAKLRVLMRAELKHLQSQLGITTIYVTHDQAEAMTLADKLIVMNAGCIQQVGRPDEVYRRPANKFVAGFIGSPPMNFIDCRFDAERGLLLGSTFAYPLGAGWQQVARRRQAGDVTLGIRPEDVAVLHTASPGAIEGEVYVTEQLGREIQLTATVGDTTVRAFAPPDAVLEAGQAVWLAFEEKSIHLFDGKTEASLLFDDGSGGSSAAA